METNESLNINNLKQLLCDIVRRELSEFKNEILQEIKEVKSTLLGIEEQCYFSDYKQSKLENLCNCIKNEVTKEENKDQLETTFQNFPKVIKEDSKTIHYFKKNQEIYGKVEDVYLGKKDYLYINNKRQGDSLITYLLKTNILEILKTLDLSSNLITNDGFNNIKECKSFDVLTSLNLSCNSIGNDAFRHLEELTKNLGSLTVLDLSENNFSDQGILLLNTSNFDFNSLKSLILSNNDISSDVQRELLNLNNGETQILFHSTHLGLVKKQIFYEIFAFGGNKLKEKLKGIKCKKIHDIKQIFKREKEMEKVNRLKADIQELTENYPLIFEKYSDMAQITAHSAAACMVSSIVNHGIYIIAGFYDGVISMHNVMNRYDVIKFPQIYKSTVMSMILLELDGITRLVTGAQNDKPIIIWDIEKQQPLYYLKDKINTIESVMQIIEITIDEKRFLVNGGEINGEYYVMFWDLKAMKLAFRIYSENSIFGLAFIEKEDYLYTASGNNNYPILKWDIRKRTYIKSDSFHTESVRAIIPIDLNGIMHLVTASYDTTIKLWSKDLELIKTLQGHTDRIWCLKALRNDNGRMLLASGGNEIIIWDLLKEDSQVHSINVQSPMDEQNPEDESASTNLIISFAALKIRNKEYLASASINFDLSLREI